MTDVDLFSQAEMQHEMLMQLEAIIFASDAPVSLARLKEAFQDQYSKSELRQLIQQLMLLQHGRSIELVETAQGFRFQVRAKYRQIITQTWPERPTRLSPSLLEINPFLIMVSKRLFALSDVISLKPSPNAAPANSEDFINPLLEILSLIIYLFISRPFDWYSLYSPSSS